MKKKIQALRNMLLAALAPMLAFSMVYAVVPVRAATTTETKEADRTFDFRLDYSWDAAMPKGADNVPIAVTIMDNNKAVAHAYLNYGQRYKTTLADGTYKVNIYNAQNGKLLDSLHLSHSTDQKDNDLSVLVRVPGMNKTAPAMVKYEVKAE
jgi:hypothetical protein